MNYLNIISIIVSMVSLIVVLNMRRDFSHRTERSKKRRKSSSRHVLDSSALIDERVVGIIKSKVLGDTTVTVLSAVQNELQLLADGRDTDKRRRARVALERIVELRHFPGIELDIVEVPKTDTPSADPILLDYCKKNQAVLCTTDYALQQRAEAHDINVMNPNQLLYLVQTRHAVGDELTVTPVRTGEKQGQLHAYLPDGTLVVVTQASARDLNQPITVLCRKLFQTKSGRMMFAEKRTHK